MKTSTVLAAVLVIVGLFYQLSGTVNIPDVPQIDPPSADLQKAVASITVLFSSGNREQAAELFDFYFEASKIIRRDGKNERILKTNSQLRTFCERAIKIRFSGAFQKVDGLADAIHGKKGSLSKIIGLSPGELDHEKVADAFYAIAWACQEAK